MKPSKVYTVSVYIILSVLVVILCFPLAMAFFMSFMGLEDLQSMPRPFLPTKWEFGNYTHIISAFGTKPDGSSWLGTYFWNSLYTSVLETTGMIIAATFCAYGFAKIKFKSKNICFALMMGTIMIPAVVMQIPQFILFKNFGWLDTHWVLWFPAWFGGGAMRIFLMRQFMRSLPDSLFESAYLDGATYLRSYWSIALPLLKPMMFVDIIGAIGGFGGDWYRPFIYINTKEKWPLGLAIKNMSAAVTSNTGFGEGNTGVQMAVGMCMSIAPLVTYALGQKNYIENVTITGIKG